MTSTTREVNLDYVLEQYGTDYYIIVSHDEEQMEMLIRDVNYLHSNGYTPTGGVSVRNGERGAYLMQAMIRNKAT